MAPATQGTAFGACRSARGQDQHRTAHRGVVGASPGDRAGDDREDGRLSIEVGSARDPRSAAGSCHAGDAHRFDDRAGGRGAGGEVDTTVSGDARLVLLVGGRAPDHHDLTREGREGSCRGPPGGRDAPVDASWTRCQVRGVAHAARGHGRGRAVPRPHGAAMVGGAGAHRR